MTVAVAACTYSVPNVRSGDAGALPVDAGEDAPRADAAIDASPEVLPAVLTTGLDLHLRAADLKLDDGARIASWTDIAGMGLTLAQTDDAMKPIFRRESGAEPNAVEFPERTHLAVSSSSSVTFRYAAGVSFTVAAVFRTNVTTTERYEQVVGNEFAGGPRVGFALDVDSQLGHPIFSVHRGCDGGCTGVTGQANVRDGAWHWVAGAREGESARLYVDGRSDGVLASGAGDSLETADDLRVGASTFNALPFVGRVAEVLVWRRALGEADIAALDAHLRTRAPIAP